MPSVDDKATEGDESQEPPPNPHQMHVYPFPHALAPAQHHPIIRAKRRQVKNACTHCQKACKKCDDARPCLRCVKYGISDECVNSERKERRRGVKRGPYKKRDGKGSSVDQDDVLEPTTAEPASNTVPPPGEPPYPGPYLPIGYSPGFYSPYTPTAHTKQAEIIPLYATGPPPPSTTYFLDHIQNVHQPPPEAAAHVYPPQAFYQAAVISHMAPYHPPQYTVPRPDIQAPDQYPLFYQKQIVASQGEMVSPPRSERTGLLVNAKQA